MSQGQYTAARRAALRELRRYRRGSRDYRIWQWSLADMRAIYYGTEEELV